MANAKPDAARLQARLDALTRSYESLEREVEHYQQVANCVRRTQRALTQSRRTEEILAALLKQVSELVPLSRSAILEWGADGLTARTVAVHGFRSSPALIGRHVPLAEIPELDEVRREGAPVLVRQTRTAPHWIPSPQDADERRDWLGLPLTSRGQCIGCMVLESAPHKRFNHTHIQIAESMSGPAATAIDNATLRARFHDMAADRAQLAQANRNFIGGLAQQLAAHLEPVESKLAALDPDVAQALEAVLHLTHQVDELSGIRSGIGGTAAQTVDLQAIFGRLAHTVEPAARENGTHLEWTVDVDDPRLIGTGDSLYRGLYELLTNAIRVSPGGSVHVSVQRRRRGGWVIRVQDSGPGLDQEDQRACLDAFWQGPARNPQGSGLGLFNAAMHTRALGGQLQVWSQPGMGAIFSMLLPPARRP